VWLMRYMGLQLHGRHACMDRQGGGSTKVCQGAMGPADCIHGAAIRACRYQANALLAGTAGSTQKAMAAAANGMARMHARLRASAPW
jgi:hypothetical protein